METPAIRNHKLTGHFLIKLLNSVNPTDPLMYIELLSDLSPEICMFFIFFFSNYVNICVIKVCLLLLFFSSSSRTWSSSKRTNTATCTERTSTSLSRSCGKVGRRLKVRQRPLIVVSGQKVEMGDKFLFKIEMKTEETMLVWYLIVSDFDLWYLYN